MEETEGGYCGYIHPYYQRGIFTMNCSACGMQLPAGVTYCPNCGNPKQAYYAPTGASQDNPTVSSSSANVPPPPPPYTIYGSQPYGVQSPYSTPPPNPYNTLPPASYVSNGKAQLVPPPPPSQRRSNRTGLIIGVVVLVLVILVGGVLAVSHLGTQGSSSSATPTVAPAQATEATQAHATA